MIQPALALCLAAALAAGPAGAGAQQPVADTAALRNEIEQLNRSMIAAFNRSPASVASFYTDDARVIGGGQRTQGRAQIDAYWAQFAGYRDWSLEVLTVGGHPSAPWLLGRSTITGPSGRTQAVDFLGVLRRMPDGALKYQIDFFTSAAGGAGVPTRRQPPVSAVPASTGPRTPFSGPARTVLAAGVVDVPLEKIGQFYYVDVRLNGRPFRFTVETGAGFFAISARAAAELELRVDTVEVMPGYRAPVARVDSLAMHGVAFHQLSARIVPSFAGSEFDGVISIPVLRDLLATLDLGASRLRLERGELPAPNGRDVLAIAGKDRGQRVDFEMRLGGVSVPAVIDTRSYISVLAPDSMERELKLADSPRFIGNAYGPSVGAFTLRGAHLSSGIRVGEYVIERPAIVLRNRPGVVVGVPFLEQFAITIDQRNQRIRFARPGRGSVAVVPPAEWETDTTRAPATLAQGSPPGGAAPGPRRAVTGPTPAARPMGFNLAGTGNGELTVVNLLPGSNGDKAGIRDGDQLVEFDGMAARAMNPAGFRASVEKGVPIKVIVLRDGKQLEFMIQPQAGQ